jgi:hypothetical protein
VNALRRIHAGLVPSGLLIDTQPVSPHPPIRQDNAPLGTLDMREWAATIAAVDRETARTVDGGLYRLECEHTLTVTDTYDDGPELLSEVREWEGTRIPTAVAHTLSAISTPASLDQEIRLRIYRTLEPG